MLLLSIAILLVAIARVRLLGVPLERDEGEYAYIGDLMLHGVAPYGVAANMKLPGTNAAYALIMALFGRSIIGIHLGFLLVNAGAIALVFFLGRRLFGRAAGLAAAASYAVMTVGAPVLGLWAHATHFVVLPALGATLLLLQWAERRDPARLAIAGLLFGLAFLMKQPGILFPVFGMLCLLYIERDQARPIVLRNAAIFIAAAATPFAVTCALLWRAGVSGLFWLWVFRYASTYVSHVSMAGGLHAFAAGATPILVANLGICLLAAAGLFFLWRQREHRHPAVILTLLLVCSFVAVCPGLYFRQHYYVLVLPSVALLVGAFVGTWRRAAPALWLVVAALTYSIGKQAPYLFTMTPEAICRSVYGLNPFPEAIPVADYIRDHTDVSDRIVVLGSEPEIYFYAQRRAVTPYVYVYPLVEAQPFAGLMQADFIRDVENGKPEFMVCVNLSASWLIQPNSPAGLFRWATPYYLRHYQQVGVVELYSNGPVYHWDADASGYQPKSSKSILVLRRRSS